MPERNRPSQSLTPSGRAAGTLWVPGFSVGGATIGI